MKQLEKILNGRKTLVFLDLEGTQFSHEMIEMGAIKVDLKSDGSIKRIHKGYRTYVLAKNKIGKIVTELTGITEEKIKKDGVPFRVALQELTSYCGKTYKKMLFVTFGTHDLRIIMQSVQHNLDADKELARFICHNSFDLSEFISRFIKDENGNPYSLANYLKVFNLDFEGTQHEALDDTLNLVYLYRALLANPNILSEEYKKLLLAMRHIPTPFVHMAMKLEKGEVVTPQDFEKDIKDYVS